MVVPKPANNLKLMAIVMEACMAEQGDADEAGLFFGSAVANSGRAEAIFPSTARFCIIGRGG